MNFETIKSFVLFILVGTSFLLSYIIWSYQPNYDLVYDTSYVNEVNIGGVERSKSELIKPEEIIYRYDNKAFGFVRPQLQNKFYEEIISWTLDDFEITDHKGRPNNGNYIEINYVTQIPAELLTILFKLNDEVTLPEWSFDKVYLTLNKKKQDVSFIAVSSDQRQQIKATIEKSDAYTFLETILLDDELEEYLMLTNDHSIIYFPKYEQEITAKTLVAGLIDTDLFINALFSNPNLVRPNVSEAYFTDGQRGMRVLNDNKRLEYINPVQTSFERLQPIELLEKSINHINEHKGWVNQYRIERIEAASNRIRYRLNYEGYKVFDNKSLSYIEQEWRGQDLLEYNRPLIYLGNKLNDHPSNLPLGDEVLEYLLDSDDYNINNINDVQIGYTLSYMDDAHSLILQPDWYVLYINDWIKLDINLPQEIEF